QVVRTGSHRRRYSQKPSGSQDWFSPSSTERPGEALSSPSNGPSTSRSSSWGSVRESRTWCHSTRQSSWKRCLPMRDRNDLVALARDAAVNAYAPYSKFRVGAVALGADGLTYPGANVENAAYPAAACAEANAIARAVSEGVRKI